MDSDGTSSGTTGTKERAPARWRAGSWLALGCVGLLALGGSLLGRAGIIPDTDGDGILDDLDNCVTTPNGPNASTYACDTQLDGDHDGYGTPAIGTWTTTGGRPSSM